MLGLNEKLPSVMSLIFIYFIFFTVNVIIVVHWLGWLDLSHILKKHWSSLCCKDFFVCVCAHCYLACAQLPYNLQASYISTLTWLPLSEVLQITCNTNVTIVSL